MANVTELLLQTQAALAQANARIAALEITIDACQQRTLRNEQIFRFIAESGWDLFALVNEAGAITYVSPAVTRVMGYTVEEYIQLGVNDLTHPEDRPVVGARLRELLAVPGERRTFEMRGKHKDGRWIWLEMTAVNYLHHPDLRAILVNSRDVTERKVATLALQSTAERYRLLADSIPDALFVLGLPEAERAIPILEVNEKSCQLLGYSREELLQLTMADIDAPGIDPRQPAILERLYAGEQVTFAQTHVTRNGQQIPVEVHAQMGIVQGQRMIISLAHDISQRLRIEQDLHRFAAVVQQTDDAVVITDAPVNERPAILFANDAFTRITGYSRQEAMQRDITILQLPGTALEKDNDLRELHAVVARGEIYRGKTASYHKQGIPLTLQWSITPIVSDAGVTTNFVAIIRDITEQEAQVEQLQRVKGDLQTHQNHLDEILDTMQDALVSLSLPDEQLIYASASFAHIFGYPLQPFLNDRSFFHQVIHPDDLATGEVAIQTAFRDGFAEHEHRIILPNGQVRWLLRRAWINYDEQGRPIRLNDSARDITARKQAEEALRQSEAYLRSLVDSHTAFNIHVDMNGQIVYCNKRYAQQFGWLAPTLIGLPALAMILPEDHPKVQAVVAQCLAQVDKPVQVEVRKPTHDGGYIWTFWEFIAVTDNTGAIKEIQCVGFDITQQKQAEAEVRANEKRYRQMFELHGLPKLILDPTTGAIVDANPAAGQFYGYAVATLKTLRLFDLSLSPAADVWAQLAKAKQATLLSCEFIHRGANGSPRHVEIFTGPVESEGKQLLYSVITDTTEKAQAKAALQEANALLEQRVIERTAELEKVKNRLEAIFEHSGDAILLLDIDHGIQQANIAFERLLTSAAGSYVGKALGDFLQPSNGANLTALMSEVLSTHQTKQIEARIVHRAQGPVDVEMSLAPVNRFSPAVTSLVCIIRDITARKKAELAIAEERNLLRTLIDAIPDFIYVKDLAHRLVLNNAAHARSMGFATPAAVLGKTDAELFPQAMAAKFFADEAQLLRTGAPVVGTEERTLGQDGQEIWALTTKVPLRNLQGELIGLVGITHDISQIKATEEALRYHEQQLRESQKMLQLVLNTIPVSVFWKDRSSVYLGCNRLFAEDAGLHHTTEVVGLRDEDLPWQPSQSSAFRADDLAVMTSGMPKLAYEETLLTAAEKQLIIQTNKLPLRDEENRVIGVLGAYVDVTATKAISDALRASEEKFRQLIESAPIATIITERNGDIVLINRQTEQLFGYRREELIGRSVDLLVPAEMRATHSTYRIGYTTIPEQRRTTLKELTAQRQDGTLFPIDLQLSYIELAPTPLVMSFILDVTERKQAEEALKLALVQEKELGELKSRFVSMASHEFRTPLTTILATAETLTHYRHKMTTDQIEARLDKIRQQVTHMKEIMEDVLQLARIQAGRMEFNPTHGDLDQLCQEIIEEFESQPQEARRIIYTCRNAPVLVDFDGRLMRQVISNLIANALKYSPVEKSIQVDLAHSSDQVTLIVRDEGIGIPAKDLKHLFQPFHRASNVGTISGTGLGLSITRQVVELHGGTITPITEMGRGTSFTVCFPLPMTSAVALAANE